MGVVWRAVDTTLQREVALKFLPEALTRGPEQIARFEREAKLLASLNHPGIATVHGFHQEAGVAFLAMELVPGASLAKRIQDGPIPVEEALRLALQLTEALEAAHESGVIHRDLKPANIQVSDGGRLKVLDFGLAKAFESDPGSSSASLSPTLTTPATHAGVILGTAAYMSPEQAKGRPVDRRTDIWAFGVVVNEMLTGRRTFAGDGVSETLAAVIMGPLDLERLPGGVPPIVRRLLERCLERDARRRLRDIGEARLAIEEALAGDFAETAPRRAAATAARPRAKTLPLAAGLAAAAIGGALLARSFAPPPSAGPALRRFTVGASGPFSSTQAGCVLGIAPDGSRVAFMDAGSLKIRALDRLEPREVATQGEPLYVFWSPDSRWLGYGTQGKLWRAPADGGESTLIATLPGLDEGGGGASWSEDGRIVFTQGTAEIAEVPASGGDAKVLYSMDPNSGGDLHEPQLLPDGTILYVQHTPGGRPDSIFELRGGLPKLLLRLQGLDLWHPVYSRTGHILYSRRPTNAGIWALPYSLAKHEATGEPFLVAPEGDNPSVADDGTLVYSELFSNRLSQLVLVDRAGKTIATVGQPQQQWPFPSLSPDGRTVAVAATEGDEKEIWLHDVTRGTKTRLTFGARAGFAAPTWSPDGRRILFDANPGAPFSTHAVTPDGRADGGELAKGWGSSLSPDGRYLLYSGGATATDFDIYFKDFQAGGDEKPLIREKGAQVGARVSPDGRYVAYMSNETGQNEIYIKGFPGGDGKWQVSVKGGAWPHWSARGDRLDYVSEDSVMEVSVAPRPSLQLGAPTELFRREPLGFRLVLGWPAGFDVSPDGQRFLLTRTMQPAKVPTGFFLVESWLSEFRKAR